MVMWTTATAAPDRRCRWCAGKPPAVTMRRDSGATSCVAPRVLEECWKDHHGQGCPRYAHGADQRSCECPRQDSNLRHRLRRAVLYPLSYGGSGAPRLPSRSPSVAEPEHAPELT